MVRYRDFADLVASRAASSPERPALLVCGDAGQLEAIAWRELASRVDARAQELSVQGSACEAILADGSAACVVEVFAAVQAGLQVALVDPLAPNQVLLALLQAVDADCVWAANAARAKEMQGLLVPGGAPAHGAHGVLFFTSGTTSSAKPVLLTDASLMSSAYNGASLLPLSQDDTLLCLLPLSHVYGFVCGLLWGLECGATVALGRGMRHYLDDMAVFNPTAVAVVPRLLELLVARQAFGQKLRLVLVGAADCPDELLAAVRGKGIRASLGYGMTETSSGIALSIGDDFHAMTICPDDSVVIADDGEILVSAPTCLMQGYYRDAERTASVLRDGLLHTGDKGFLDADGLLHVQGRMRDVLVLPTGTKVFLPEYEQAIADALGERDIAVVLRKGALTLVCGQQARQRTSHELLGAIAPAMDAYPKGSQVSRAVLLGHALPRTAAGDIERWKLQEELDNGDC